jgi:hypothetical protein
VRLPGASTTYRARGRVYPSADAATADLPPLSEVCLSCWQVLLTIHSLLQPLADFPSFDIDPYELPALPSESALDSDSIITHPHDIPFSCLTLTLTEGSTWSTTVH